MPAAVVVDSVSKKFLLGETFSGSLREKLLRMWRLKGSLGEDAVHWALKDVSFSIEQGEAVGIIGSNGAGKSTLLKILSRITPPTEGRALIRGRLSSLLEVGTGFHPELTGRENVYLNGSILGMRKAEINRKFDEIVGFAGVEAFIDTPVKRYSSGMRVRLGFAVAAHLEPDVLVIDEVLAVGDIDFQKRCLTKLQEVTGEGRTVIFVSHNLGAVSRLCKKCVLLDKGRIKSIGETYETLMRYQLDSTGLFGSAEKASLVNVRIPPEAILKEIKLSQDESVVTGGKLELRISLIFGKPEDYGLDVLLQTSDGDRLMGIASHLVTGRTFQTSGRAEHSLVIPELPLAADVYRLSLRITRPGAAVIEDHPFLAELRVFPKDIYGTGFVPLPTQTRLALRAHWSQH